jgi:hypothetical protein
MNYPAMRWAVEDCRREGAAKPILFVIAYRADRDTGECWMGQRRIAREAGVDPKTVERVIPELLAAGDLELVERSRGPKPNCYRIAPAWVEGEASASGKIIHNPEPTADTMSALEVALDKLLPTSNSASADIGRSLVPTLGHESADSQVPLSSGNAEKVLNFKGIDRREVQVRENASSAADAAGVLAAVYTPPEVSDEQKAWLAHRFGLKRPPPRPPFVVVDQQTTDQAAQLAELERRYPDQFKSGQEQEPAAEPHAGVASGTGQALDATVAVAVHTQVAGHRGTWQPVPEPVEVEPADQGTARDHLHVVNE